MVAVSFADGNVCANGAWDRVIRVVRSCGKSDVAQLLRFLKLIFVDAFSLQIAVLCDGGSLPCQTQEWWFHFGSQRTKSLQWIVQRCSDKGTLLLLSLSWAQR